MLPTTALPKLDDFLTVGEAAKFVGVPAATLRNWDRSGKLKAYRHAINGYRLYRKDQLQDLLQTLVSSGPRHGN